MLKGVHKRIEELTHGYEKTYNTENIAETYGTCMGIEVLVRRGQAVDKEFMLVRVS